MNFSAADYKSIQPFLKWSYPSFRLRPNGSYTILGLIEGQQFIVEGVFESRIPKAGLYCVEAAKGREFKSSTATPAPPEAHASYSARSVKDVAVFVLPEVKNADSNPSLAHLKKIFKIPNNTDVLLTPYDPSNSLEIEHQPGSSSPVTFGAYGDVHLPVKSEGASGDTYLLNKKIIECLPDYHFECSITEQQVMIMESKKHGYYFITGVERIDPEKYGVITKDAAVSKSVDEMKSFDQ